MSKPLHLIFIENDDNDFELVLIKLREAGYMLEVVRRVETEEEFKNALTEKNWDIILSDYHLPRFSAPIALTSLRQSGLDIPFIIISGTIGEERAASSLRAGARDFVSKNDLGRLVPVIERELRELASRKVRLKVERAYQASEQRYKLIVNTAREGIVMISRLGAITFVNKEMARLLGQHEQEIINKNIQDFLSRPDDFKDVTFLEWLTSADGVQQTIAFTCLDEYEWWGSTKVSEIPADASGELTYLCMITDVSEQVKSRNTIEALVDELKEALRARDEFLSIASHELKTPLTSLLMQAQNQKRRISKGDESAYDKERINYLAEQTEKLSLRLNRLVEDMLDISRIRSGQLTIIREPVDLHLVMQDVLKRLSPQFTRSGSGQPSYTGQSVKGHWDTVRLEQVFTNLLTNAIRYGKGQPINVSLYQQDGYALLSVEDQGIGIDKDSQQRIFDRFERAINPSDVSGLGLGLFISREIVKAHEGTIWVESEAGKGSKFTVKLPVTYPTPLF